MGRTDKQIGRTDKPMGRADKSIGRSDKPMGRIDKPMGHQPGKVLFKVKTSQDRSIQVRTGLVQSGQVSKSHIHFRTRKEKTGQGI